jgi:hypothetical protein
MGTPPCYYSKNFFPPEQKTSNFFVNLKGGKKNCKILKTTPKKTGLDKTQTSPAKKK